MAAMAMDSTAMDDDSDEIGSQAQSCISNETDFLEDDEFDYLALEVVNYLPQDKAEMLMKNLRAKERAIEDLLRRNHSLLDTCGKLDQENQNALERCDDLSRRAEAAELEARVAKENSKSAPAPASTPPTEAAPTAAPGPKVDTSYFQKMEQGKEEKILRLSAENERLVALSRRCQEQVGQMDARLQEVTKEAKQLRRKLQEGGGEARERAPVRNSSAELDEEERLFQEMQQSEQADMIARKMKSQMVEQRRKLAYTLEQVLSRDVLEPVSAWDSEVSALALQMETVEKCLGGVGKGLKADSSGPSSGGGKKKGGGPKKGEDTRLDSGWVDETSALLLDHFQAMRSNLDTVDVARHTLEDAAHRFSDGSPELVACFENTLEGAEAEAEWIREHNAAWVEKATKLGLGEVVNLVERVEGAVRGLFATAPPGLLPPGVEQTLVSNLQQLAAMKAQLASQAGSIQDLQDESISVGRRVRALQSELKTHKALLHERVTNELRAQLRPVADAERHLGDALRRQRGLEDRARKEASDFLEEFSAAVRRAGAALSSTPASGAGDSGGTAAARESFTEAQKGAKEVRAALASLHNGLDRGHRDMGEKLAAVLDALVGAEAEAGAQQGAPQARPPARGGNVKDSDGHETGLMSRDTEGKEKRKKGKKKGKAGDREEAAAPRPASAAQEAPPTRTSAAEPVGRATAASDRPDSAPAAPATAVARAPKAPAKEAMDAEAELRAELAREFADATPTAVERNARNEAEAAERTKSGKDLLKELKSLKSASDELEERIASRLAKKSSSDAPKETLQKTSLRKKKLLYA